ncbi:MAG: AMP-binding protein [Neomegalonema sp.]|nr:AMP-binding protein [Neomegalonema sp.]
MSLISFSDAHALSWEDFARDVARTQAALRPAGDVCNMAADRYAFLVGLAAALLNGQRTILPASTAPEALVAAHQDARDLLVFEALPEAGQEPGEHLLDPIELRAALGEAQGVIDVFTSGSTGAPQRHRKTWNILNQGAAITRTALARLGLKSGTCGLLCTTAHQHMFGLEAAVFMTLGHGFSLYDAPIFFPADLERAVKVAERAGLARLALITSPAHLRHLEAALQSLPQIRGIVCATAPLPLALAQRLEARGSLGVMEVYGSTETGSLALRRPVRDEAWEMQIGFEIREQEGRFFADAPHLPGTVALGDALEMTGPNRFHLRGRLGEMVNVYGKRASLNALNEVLLETEGVLDGVILHQQAEQRDRIEAAIVIEADKLGDEPAALAAVRAQFHRHFDPIFAPKRVHLMTSLPRGGAGKIAGKDLARLKQQCLLAEG